MNDGINSYVFLGFKEDFDDERLNFFKKNTS